MKHILLTLFLLLFLTACKTTAPAVTPSVRQTQDTRHRTQDSVRIYERDSISTTYRPDKRSGLVQPVERSGLDTLVIEKYSIRYRDREVIKHDTVTHVQKETEVVTQKVIPPFYKRCTWGFWASISALILAVVLFVGRKMK